MFKAKRRVGERIQIGSDITITITETATGFAVVGVDAPENVTIQRIATPAPKPAERPLHRSAARNERSWGSGRGLTGRP